MILSVPIIDDLRRVNGMDVSAPPTMLQNSEVIDRELTTRQVAGLFRVNVDTIYRWKAEGVLTPIGRRRYSETYSSVEVEKVRAVPVGDWDFSAAAVLTPCEIAVMLYVHASTVKRWADAGRLVTFRTPNGARRYSREQARAICRNRGDDYIY